MPLLKVARVAAHTAHPHWYRAVLAWAMLVLLHLPGFPMLTDDLPPAVWAAVAGDVVLFGVALFAATALRRAPRATALVLLLLGLYGAVVLVRVCVALLGGRPDTPFFAVSVAATTSLAAALVVALVLAWPFRAPEHVVIPRSVPGPTPDPDAGHRGGWMHDLSRSRALWYAVLYAVLVGTGRYWSTAIPLGDSLFSLLVVGGLTIAPAAFGYWIVREARAPTVSYALVVPGALVVLALAVTALVPSMGRGGVNTRDAFAALIWMMQLVGLKLWCLAIAGGAFAYADRQAGSSMLRMRRFNILSGVARLGIPLAIGAAAGWLAGTRWGAGGDGAEADYRALSATGVACAAVTDSGEGTAALGAALAAVLPPTGPTELPAAAALAVRREAGAATVTLVTHGVDDEVLAEGVRFRVGWEPGGGWRVTGCERALRPRD